MTILGHSSARYGRLAYDRVLGTRSASAAVENAGLRRLVRGHDRAARDDIVLAPLAEALAEPKLLDPAFFETAEVFFG
jgi:6-phosphofructokinase 1